MGLGIFAVGGGGPKDVLGGCFGGFLGAFDDRFAGRLFLSDLGLGVAPPYFSSNCWVESYFVAALSFSIVFTRSVC